MNYERFQNDACLARRPAPLRKLHNMIIARPDTVSMAGGIPDPETFPIIEATIKLRDGSEIQIDKDDMKFCLQYTLTEGFTKLRHWLNELQRRVHNPPAMEDSSHPGQTDLIILNGNQDALAQSLDAMVSPGDNILVASPTYPGPVSLLKPLGCNFLPIESDEDGMDPDKLRHILSRWSPADAKDPKSDIPKILYCVPTGGNPSGFSLTLKRKQEIYKLAREYDLIILEDDPYYYIQFTETLVPSFLSLDVDGRVMRFDSFSKVISPGARIGFLTGPKPLVQKVLLKAMSSTLQASGISQMFLLAILENWGHDRFLDRAKEITNFYRNKCQQCIGYIKKHLTGLVEWAEPSGGLFIWMKILGVTDTADLLSKAYLNGVLFVAGNVFHVDRSLPSEYIRVSFSVATSEKMDQGFSILAKCLKEELSQRT